MRRSRMRCESGEIQQAARTLRKAMTPAERQLWAIVRRNHPRKFRRQHPLYRFILDSYCPAARLCIELDGSVHDAPGQAEQDLARTEELSARGIRVLRFRNNEVLLDAPSVLRRISSALQIPPPRPHAGEGGEPQRGG